MTLGQTRPVKFPSGITGVISQRILVNQNGRVGCETRHGGARLVYSGFSDNLRAELAVCQEKGAKIGEQSLIIFLYPAEERENN